MVTLKERFDDYVKQAKFPMNYIAKGFTAMIEKNLYLKIMGYATLSYGLIEPDPTTIKTGICLLTVGEVGSQFKNAELERRIETLEENC